MVVIPEPRIEGLCRIYKPKKVSMASLELVNTPGLSRSHEGSAARLALIREAGCLVQVIDVYTAAQMVQKKWAKPTWKPSTPT